MTNARLVTGFIAMLLSMQVIGASRNAAHRCGSFYMKNISARALCNLAVPTKLNLKNCQIKDVDKEAFDCSEELRELEYLYLASNMISSLPAKVFRGLHYVVVLSLAGA